MLIFTKVLVKNIRSTHKTFSPKSFSCTATDLPYTKPQNPTARFKHQRRVTNSSLSKTIELDFKTDHRIITDIGKFPITSPSIPNPNPIPPRGTLRVVHPKGSRSRHSQLKKHRYSHNQIEMETYMRTREQPQLR